MVKKQTYCFSDTRPNIEKTPEGELAISGWSVHKGIYHDGMIEIPNSELPNIAESLLNKHLFKDHVVSTDTTVGRVTETRVGIDRKVGKSGVKYKGTIEDPSLEKKINKGLIDNVSIGFTLFPECSVCGEDFSDFNACPHWFDTAHIIARNCECYEQSILPLGADGDTTIEPASSFSMDMDFAKQFQPKLEKMEKSDMKIDKNTGQSLTTDSTSQPINITIPSITLPPVTDYEYSYTGTSSKDGENMKEYEKLQADFDELSQKYKNVTGELTEATEKIDELETEKEELTEKVETLETEKEELTTTLGETQSKLQDYVEADEEAEKLALKTLKDEVIQLQIEKGFIKEEEAEEKFEELTDDEQALEQMKEVLAQIVEKSKEEQPPVGEFEEHKDGEKAMPDKTEKDEAEFDMKDPGLQKTMFKRMFKYPKSYLKK